MINYIVNLIFTRRKYIENVRDSIAVYEYNKTGENLDKICIETHKLARFYNDIYWTKHEYVLGEFLWKLQHLDGLELAMAIFEYQQWLNDLVRSKRIVKWIEQRKRPGEITVDYAARKGS